VGGRSEGGSLGSTGARGVGLRCETRLPLPGAREFALFAGQKTVVTLRAGAIISALNVSDSAKGEASPCTVLVTRTCSDPG
jgi:hypothetical protein